MHTGKRNPPHLPENGQNDRFFTQLISGSLLHAQNKLLSLVLTP